MPLDRQQAIDLLRAPNEISQRVAPEDKTRIEAGGGQVLIHIRGMDNPITINYPSRETLSDPVALAEAMANTGLELNNKFSEYRNAMNTLSSGMNEAQKLSLMTGAMGVAPDVLGTIGDMQMYIEDPESRTLFNGFLTLLGAVPGIPSVAGVMKRSGKKFQWMRNAEGGQKFGNRQIVTGLDKDLYDEHIKKLTGIEYDDYRAQYPDNDSISLVELEDGRVVVGQGGTGPESELIPATRESKMWMREVDDWDEGIEWGRHADSEGDFVERFPAKHTQDEVRALITDAGPDVNPAWRYQIEGGVAGPSVEDVLQNNQNLWKPTMRITRTDPLGPGGLGQSTRVDVEGEQLRRNIDAWHGSPHKFDTFSMEHLGKGEGAQAYGHGLYFAEHPDVAKGYQPRSFEAEEMMMEKYKAAERAQDYEEMEIWESAMMHETPDEIIKRYSTVDYDDSMRDKALKVAGELNEMPAQGGLYNVNLNVDPDGLLDWDAPIKQQSQSVRDALEPLRDEVQDMAFSSGGVDINLDDVTGEELVSMILPDIYGDSEKASQALKDRGIPGLRYLDGGSRTTGEGTRNLVIFDDSLVTVKTRNGEAVSDAVKADVLGVENSLTTIYHGTSPESAEAIKAGGFNLQDSGTGSAWFTSNPDIGEVGAIRKGAVVPMNIDESKAKLAGWAEDDKFSMGELIEQGYDGLKLEDEGETTYRIWNTDILQNN